MAMGRRSALRLRRIPMWPWSRSPDPRELALPWPLAAAPTVKRVTQELGGKSANIILDDADFEKAVKQGVQECFRNTGQSCNAPTRMLVPRSKMAEVVVAAQTGSRGHQSW